MVLVNGRPRTATRAIAQLTQTRVTMFLCPMVLHALTLMYQIRHVSPVKRVSSRNVLPQKPQQSNGAPSTMNNAVWPTSQSVNRCSVVTGTMLLLKIWPPHVFAANAPLSGQRRPHAPPPFRPSPTTIVRPITPFASVSPNLSLLPRRVHRRIHRTVAVHVHLTLHGGKSHLPSQALRQSSIGATIALVLPLTKHGPMLQAIVHHKELLSPTLDGVGKMQVKHAQVIVHNPTLALEDPSHLPKPSLGVRPAPLPMGVPKGWCRPNLRGMWVTVVPMVPCLLTVKGSIVESLPSASQDPKDVCALTNPTVPPLGTARLTPNVSFALPKPMLLQFFFNVLGQMLAKLMTARYVKMACALAASPHPFRASNIVPPPIPGK